MPRPKIIRKNIKALPIYKTIIEALTKDPDFAECDFTTMTIVAKQRAPQSKIMDIESPIRRLTNYIRNNGNCKVGKLELSRILKISRPTLNKWIDLFLDEGAKKEVWSRQAFDLQIVLENLIELKEMQEETVRK